MTRYGENNHHVHDGYGKETASSSNIKDTDEDKDEDESTSSESKVKMEGSGKWLVTALYLNTKPRSKKY